MISIIRYWLTFVVLCLYGLLVGCREEANNHIHFSTGEHLLSTPAIYMTSQIDNTLNTPPSLTIVADSAPTLTPLPEPSLTPVGTPLAVPEKPLDGGVDFVAELPPNPSGASPQPSHVWWSEDSTKLFFQDVISHEAWVYDLDEQTISPIPYEAHSWTEVLHQLSDIIPPEAIIFSISPSGRSVLFGTPLAEPIVSNASGADINDSPRFTYELWLSKNRERQSLGLVDSCFGYFDAFWTRTDRYAFVNGGGVPDVPFECMYDVWVVDTEELTVGPMPVSWQGSDRFDVVDVLADGKYVALRKDVVYIHELATQHEVAFSAVDTNRLSLVFNEDALGLVFFEAVFTPSVLDATTVNDEIYYIDAGLTAPVFLGSVEGIVDQRTVSPNGKRVALTTVNSFGGQEFANLKPGLWVLTVPGD